jgi:hypothetical protein
MTRRTVTELYTQAASSFPDNIAGSITPALLRAFCQDFLDTIRPSYGAMSITTPVIKALTTVDSSFTWETVVAAQAPDYTCTLASGLITRDGGPASAQISFSIDCQAPNNNIVTFTLYVDGVVTPWATSNTSTSAADVQSFAFMAINYSANLAPTYQIRAKMSVAGNATLSNGVLVAQNIPVNTN